MRKLQILFVACFVGAAIVLSPRPHVEAQAPATWTPVWLVFDQEWIGDAPLPVITLRRISDSITSAEQWRRVYDAEHFSKKDGIVVAFRGVRTETELGGTPPVLLKPFVVLP